MPDAYQVFLSLAYFLSNLKTGYEINVLILNCMSEVENY